MACVTYMYNVLHNEPSSTYLCMLAWHALAIEPMCAQHLGTRLKMVEVEGTYICSSVHSNKNSLSVLALWL